jgi:hypothetical protein
VIDIRAVLKIDFVIANEVRQSFEMPNHKEIASGEKPCNDVCGIFRTPHYLLTVLIQTKNSLYT